MYTKPLNMIGG